MDEFGRERHKTHWYEFYLKQRSLRNSLSVVFRVFRVRILTYLKEGFIWNSVGYFGGKTLGFTDAIRDIISHFTVGWAILSAIAGNAPVRVKDFIDYDNA